MRKLVKAHFQSAPVSDSANRSSRSSRSTYHRATVSHFADKYGVTVNVVGSRAKGTAGPRSDFDYILGDDGATSRLRQKARRELPRGIAGGEIHPTRGETGIDVFKKTFDRDLPYIPFNPKVPE